MSRKGGAGAYYDDDFDDYEDGGYDEGDYDEYDDTVTTAGSSSKVRGAGR
jgi:hypothetical protein